MYRYKDWLNDLCQRGHMKSRGMTEKKKFDKTKMETPFRPGTQGHSQKCYPVTFQSLKSRQVREGSRPGPKNDPKDPDVEDTIVPSEPPTLIRPETSP